MYSSLLKYMICRTTHIKTYFKMKFYTHLYSYLWTYLQIFLNQKLYFVLFLKFSLYWARALKSLTHGIVSSDDKQCHFFHWSLYYLTAKICITVCLSWPMWWHLMLFSMEKNSIYLTVGAMVLEPELDLLGTHAKPLTKGLPEFLIWIRGFPEDTTYDINENRLVHIIFDR